MLIKIWNVLPQYIQMIIIKVLLYKKYSKTKIEHWCFFKLSDIIYNRIHIGHYSFIWEKWKFLAGEKSNITIGKYCSIASEVYIITYNHSYNHISHHINQWFENLNFNIKVKEKSVSIWNDVWIWARCIILPWVTIWDWAIIWAGSIVTKDVESYSIYAGNPAKRIKDRFSKKNRKYIESLHWWDWSNDKIIKNKKIFENEIID